MSGGRSTITKSYLALSKFNTDLAAPEASASIEFGKCATWLRLTAGKKCKFVVGSLDTA
jgi:hypothetical protein